MKNFNEIKDAFGDDWIQGFFYNIYGKRIELYFDRYFDVNIGKYKEVSCKFIIEKWGNAYSIPYDIDHKTEQKSGLDNNMAIFFMIMDMKFEYDVFEIVVNTIDERYITYIFENPILDIIEVPPLPKVSR